MSARRLPRQPGEWIDRERPIPFHFEDQAYQGFAGDTLTSALAACGVTLLGRSFKYHRPRGLLSMANHDVNAMVEDGTRTNLRGDILPIEPQARFKAVNTFGGLKEDRAGFIDRCGAFLPVGFYYKTFHHPRRWFPFFERKMREMAGLGAINTRLTRRRTPKNYDFCDVLVIGGGPTGLSAAIAAAESGADVLLVDENRRAGGSLNYQFAGDAKIAETLADLRSRAAALGNLRQRVDTVAAGCYADRWVGLVDATRLTKLRADSIVMATGAIEQPAVFGNNDLPGVMLATGAQRLIHLFAVRPCDRAVIVAANVEGYRAALDLARAGVTVEAIVDMRPGGEPSEVAAQVARETIRVLKGHAVYEAIKTSDRAGVRGVKVCPLGTDGKPRTNQLTELACDAIVMSVGFAPADGLFYQAGGRMQWSEALQQFVPRSTPAGIFAAGRLNGIHALTDKMADGRRAGTAAAAYVGRFSGAIPPEVPRPTIATSHAYPIVADSKAKSFVDLDEDVQYKDIVNAAQEGFDHVELMKRYSTFGMGPSQGKLFNTNVLRILARIKGQTVGETGAPRSRPFIHPVPLEHLAGRGFHPHRETPLDSRHEKAGAVFMPAGDWRRPAYYAPAGETREQAIDAEVTAVRQAVGIIDVGTLGKLEVSGPDAVAFLERLYTGSFASLAEGAMRYALACDDTGVVIDDGIVVRLGQQSFYLTTTTTASTSMYREMQRWAIIWKMNVVLANVTGARGAVNLAGPFSRKILRGLTDVDCSQAAFPYSGVRTGTVAGVPARLLRVGFVGELGYEIHVPAYGTRRVWDALIEAGRGHGIRPFGVEAQRVLRLEKGHVIVSQDTDGLSHPFEVGMDWAVKARKPFFIGGRSLEILRRKTLKRRLVGFRLADASQADQASVKECHLIIAGGDIVGRVTSIAHSATLSQTIGLAHVQPHLAAVGTELKIRVDSGRMIAAQVVETPFYDPKNLRQTREDD